MEIIHLFMRMNLFVKTTVCIILDWLIWELGNYPVRGSGVEGAGRNSGKSKWGERTCFHVCNHIPPINKALYGISVA